MNAQRTELKTLILTLWDKAVGTPDYDKQQWKRLDFLVERLENPPPDQHRVSS